MHETDGTRRILSFNRKLLACFICLCVLCAASVPTLLFRAQKHSDQKSLSKQNNTTSISHKRNCTLVVYNSVGRLGNNLFQFASAYGLSLQYSCRLYFGPDIITTLSQYFEIHLPDLLTQSELKKTSPIEQFYNHCTHIPKLIRSADFDHLELYGYWQTYRHFVNQTDRIKQQLRFKQSVQDPVKDFLRINVSDNVSQLIGVHVRRGDYIQQRNISSDQFIFTAMNHFRRKYGQTKFVFVSDDKEYCREKFGKRNDTYFTPNSFNPAQDMALLSLCHHVIITVGTFGWWGAYLLQNRSGEILTDSKPNHDPLDIQCKASEYFPPWFTFLNQTN